MLLAMINEMAKKTIEAALTLSQHKKFAIGPQQDILEATWQLVSKRQ